MPLGSRCTGAVAKASSWLSTILLLLLRAPGAFQQATPFTCSGGDGKTRSISSLNSQQLAEGALATSVLSAWDFQGQPGVLAATAGKGLTLSCVVATNATVSSPSGAGAFLQPTAIDLAGAAGLEMRSVSLSTDCATVLSYQQYLCSTYRVAGSLQLDRGSVHFTTWQDGFTSLHDVTLTCPAPEAAAAPPCRLVAVQTAQQLLEAFTVYAAASTDNLTVVVAANISIPTSFWPSTPVPINNSVFIVGSSLLRRPVLDFNLMTNLWDVMPGVHVTLQNVTCVNLSPAYFSPGFVFSQFGMLSERVWAFRRFERQVTILDSTLVVPPEQLNYSRYWITFLVSPVPEAQAKASWLNVIELKVSAVNGTGVYYDTVRSFTTAYYNVRLTDTLSGYPLLPQATALQELLAENVPLTAVNAVVNASDFLLALLPDNSVPDEQGRRWVLLVGNVSLPDAIKRGMNGTVDATVIPSRMVLGRDPQKADAVRLGFGRLINVLSVQNGSTVVIRQLVLDGLAGRLSSYDPRDPMGVLSGPLWGLGLVSASSKLRLENCSVLLSADELRLMQHALLPAGAATALPGGRSYDSGLVEAVRRFYAPADALQVAAYGESHLAVDSGATQRYAMYGVTFRTPVAADGEVAAANFTALRIPYASGGGGTEGWVIGVIVGCVVGGVLLLAAAALLVLRRRSRRQAQQQDAYAKYLHNTAEPGDRPPVPPGGSGSLYINPSQELTNSSQVMRPGGRNSDIERATAGVRVSKVSDNTISGGIGAAGRSTSITGGISNEMSSGVVLGSNSDALAGGSGVGRGGGGSSGTPSLRFPTAVSAAAAAALGGDGARSTLVTDSFERPPTASNLGQSGGAARAGQRLGSILGTVPSSAGQASLTPSSPLTTGNIAQSQSAISTGGGAALDQMHAMIQILGRDFNDRQLEVHGLLGKGAHGTVYKGKWRGLPVAVKSMIFNSESSARQQQRPLMEAAISSNLAHPNIVTTYSYELREVEHELAALSPELARQGGGWRLLIIQEYCDAGPLRRIVDCGYFLTPQPKAQQQPQRTKLKLPSMGLLRKDSPSGGNGSDGSIGAVPRGDVVGSAGPPASRHSSGSSDAGNGNGNGNGARTSPGSEALARSHSPARQGGNGGGGGSNGRALGPQTGPAGGPGQPPRQALDEVPADVPPRPGNRLEAALRYVEAALMIARGLQHIHDKNIVHGDLNPNNVLLMRAPGSPLGFCLKVADFGLSVRITEGESHLSNLFQGSPYYCAPEVVMSGKIGKSADIYSLGIMLWELQNGTRPPWRMGVRLRTFPSLNTAELEFGPETPPRYARLARECFHASKDARPGIAAVVEALSAIQQELGALPRA